MVDDNGWLVGTSKGCWWVVSNGWWVVVSSFGGGGYW